MTEAIDFESWVSASRQLRTHRQRRAVTLGRGRRIRTLRICVFVWRHTLEARACENYRKDWLRVQQALRSAEEVATEREAPHDVHSTK